MKILVLGGTSFVGRHFVAHALAEGHSVTVLHRGKTAATGLPGAKEILGDRREGVHGAENESWDAVFDSSAYLPGVVNASVKPLAGRVGRYLFISTISVYDSIDPAKGEDNPLKSLDDPTTEVVNGETYGGLKVLCEQEAIRGFGDRTTIVRPGLIAGPYDPTHRYPYWVERIAEGGEYLAGWNPNQGMQQVDAADLAEFSLRLLTADLGGTYDVAGEATTFGAWIEASTFGEATPVWVSRDFLDQQEIRPWVDLPLTMDEEEGTLSFAVTSARAVEAGLTRRPILETARRTLDWIETVRGVRASPYSFSRERERAALDAWRTNHG